MESNQDILKLDQVVNFYLDAWEMPDSQYRRISGFGIRALLIIHQQATAASVGAELDVDRNKTCSLPGGCLKLVGIRIGGPDGLPMVEDSEIGLRDESCGCERGHDVACGYYGQRYNYRLDGNTIIFHNSFVGKNIYVEYVPLMKHDGEYVVDPTFLEAILAFIGWQDKRRTASDRAKSEDEWWNWLRVGRRSKVTFSVEQILEDYRRNFKILLS